MDTHLDRRRLRHVYPATPDGCAKGGRAAGKIALENGRLSEMGRYSAHLKWHIRRQILNPYCEFCLEGCGLA
jgi:hypothetical protein